MSQLDEPLILPPRSPLPTVKAQTTERTPFRYPFQAFIFSPCSQPPAASVRSGPHEKQTLMEFTPQKLERLCEAAVDPERSAPRCVAIHTPPIDDAAGSLSSSTALPETPYLHRIASESSIETHYQFYPASSDDLEKRSEFDTPQIHRRLDFLEDTDDPIMEMPTPSYVGSGAASSSSSSSNGLLDSLESRKRKRPDEAQRPLESSFDVIDCSSQPRGSQSSYAAGSWSSNMLSRLAMTTRSAAEWKPGWFLAIEECTMDLTEFLEEQVNLTRTIGTGSVVIASCVGAVSASTSSTAAAPPSIIAASSVQELVFTGEPISTVALGIAFAGCVALPLAIRGGEYVKALSDENYQSDCVETCSLTRSRTSTESNSTTLRVHAGDAAGGGATAVRSLVGEHSTGADNDTASGSLADTGTALENDDAVSELTTATCNAASVASDTGSMAAAVRSIDAALASLSSTLTGSAAGSANTTAALSVDADLTVPDGAVRTFFFVDNTLLHAMTSGLGYRYSKDLSVSSKVDERALAPWGQWISGVDEQDGWLRVGDFYLPTAVNDVPVLRKHTPDLKAFIVDNSELQDMTHGLGYRRSKKLEDKAAELVALWGSRVCGVDEGDGWVRISGDFFLPVIVRGITVLVKDNVGVWEGMPATVTSDAQQLERSVRDCGLAWPNEEPSGQKWSANLGRSSIVIKVDLAHGIVQLEDNLGWVPITSLLGFQDWSTAHDSGSI